MPERLILVAGATGFIGKALCRRLALEGYRVAALTRNAGRARAVLGSEVGIGAWDGRTAEGWRDLASSAEAIIDLAGENIGAGRWTAARKAKILESRLLAGRAVTEALRLASPRPGTLLQASAVGYYGSRGDEELDESSPPGEGFLADVVRRWEEATRGADELGVRRVVFRSGLVLGTAGGSLPRFFPAFRLGLGGPVGSGRQWMSWIHLEDEVGAIVHLLERPDLAGVFNLVSPGAATMNDFARTLGRVMRRSSWLRTPAFLVRWLLGQMAEETILSGQRVRPKALDRSDFRFLYPGLETALRSLLERQQVRR